MEVFDIGSHVTIELDEGLPDARRIAGYIHSVTDEGLVLKATHKDIPFVGSVPVEDRSAAREFYASSAGFALRVDLVRRGEFAAALGDKASMVEALVDLACEEAIAVAESRNMFVLYEYKMPVLTYVGLNRIGLMEATLDVADNVDVTRSVAGLDEEIPDLLDGKVPPREDERVMDDEDGRPVDS